MAPLGLASRVMTNEVPGPVFKVGRWTVIADECRIRDTGVDLHLRPQLMDVLVLLAARAGSVVTKDDLLQYVWKREFVSESSLTRSIAELRALLGDTGSPPTIIETIPKRGYRLLAAVDPCRAAAKPCVAVLPFEHLCGPPEGDALVEGLVDAIITQLCRHRGLRAISRQSVLHLRGSQRAIGEVAREVGADAVVTGTVQRAGDRVRVSAQLIKAAPEEELWGDTYDTHRGDILALEDRLSKTIADAVAAALVPAAAPAPPTQESAGPARAAV